MDEWIDPGSKSLKLRLKAELTPLNIQARYPAYKEAIYSMINKEKAARIIAKTEELLQWLKAQIL